MFPIIYVRENDGVVTFEMAFMIDLNDKKCDDLIKEISNLYCYTTGLCDIIYKKY